MRHLLVLSLITVVPLLSGCTRTQPELILADNWAIGQHQDCVSKGQTLYCIDPSQIEKPLAYPGTKPEVRPEELLFTNAIVSTYDIDQDVIKNRGKATHNYEQGTFDTKFSTRTVNDYSIWDCLKTGVAAPGISCQILRPRTKADDKFLSEQATALKQSEMLKGLTLEVMVAQCGQPVEEAKNAIEKFLKYKGTSGLTLVTGFKTFPENEPHSLQHLESLDNGVSMESMVAYKSSYKSSIYWSEYSGHNFEATKQLVQELPCLAVKN